MITEDRYKYILKKIEENGSVTVTELTDELMTSESTIRRDLIALDKTGSLKKVHGGATAISESLFLEHDVSKKKTLFSKEKTEIAKYAASTIKSGDFIYIDAGTTTERMTDFITQKDITVVTNGLSHARKFAAAGIKVYVPAGKYKSVTEAITGTFAAESLSRYNFTKCYMGANGISLKGEISTPDIEEASVKSAAVKKSYVTFILADHSKFDVETAITFAALDKACIITDKVINDIYRKKCILKEVMK